MAHVLQLVRSAATVSTTQGDIKADARELADLMQRLALTQPTVLRLMLRFARKAVYRPARPWAARL